MRLSTRSHYHPSQAYSSGRSVEIFKLDLGKKGFEGIVTPLSCERSRPIPLKQGVNSSSVVTKSSLENKGLRVVRT